MEIIRGNDLERHVYQFQVHDDIGRIRIYLNMYSHQVRETKRHGWKSIQSYIRLRERESTVTLDALPKPQDVLDEVYTRLSEVVRIGWSYR